MNPIVLLVGLLLVVWLISASSERQPAPAVVVMANPPSQKQSIAAELFVIALLVFLYLLGVA